MRPGRRYSTSEKKSPCRIRTDDPRFTRAKRTPKTGGQIGKSPEYQRISCHVMFANHVESDALVGKTWAKPRGRDESIEAARRG